MKHLRRHWPVLLAQHTQLRDRLLEAYTAPGRHYHDTRHLTEVLDHLATLLRQPEAVGVDRDAVVLAAWFHDAVYAGRPDDEDRSAALASAALTGCDVRPALVAETARLVRLTRDHRPGPDDLAGQVLCDADLAILAAGPDRYDEYVRGVREEYVHLDEAAFRTGRDTVLRALLERPRLYRTSFGWQSWESGARANIQRELQR